jgi:hypothetical protein
MSNNSVILKSITECKTAKDGRLYFTAEFKSGSNPFLPSVRRMFSQTKDSNGAWYWKAANPDDIKVFIGKALPGEIITKKVVPYTIEDSDPTKPAREVDNYTTVIFAGEEASKVLRSMGHILDNETPKVTAQVTKTAEILSEDLPL